MDESAFSDELWAQIRKQFGHHCVRFSDFKKAQDNYKTSLEFQADDFDSIYCLANCQAREAWVDEALKSLNEKSGLESYKSHFKCNLQECDCYYEQNKFEKNMLALTEKMKTFKSDAIDIPFCGPLTMRKLNEANKRGPKLSMLNKRYETVCQNFDDMIGKNAGNCLYEQRKCFAKILTRWIPPEEKIDVLAQLLRSKNHCDFMERKIENNSSKRKMSMKEEYFIENIARKYAQSYMQAAWVDYVYIKDLKKNKILRESTQNPKSFKHINDLIDSCIGGTRNFIEQLHARCPLYTKRLQMIRDPERREKINTINRYRMQYQIRRDMFNALDAMHKCRAEGKLEKLIKIAEYELGKRYRVHSSKLICRKNEFTVEICNLISLAHIDKVKLSENQQTSMSDYERLTAIFGVKSKNRYAVVRYVFGDQSTYKDPAEPDTSFLSFKQKIKYFEERLSQRPMLNIEKCHLNHEMGRANLEQHRVDEARTFGQNIIKLAHNVSHLWLLLGYLVICRADVLQRNFEKLKGNMTQTMNIVRVLKGEELGRSLEEAMMITERLLEN